ncbi:MAG TPA: DUF4907 domain-containing protein [Flavobacteriales bacterium]|nr:DUF4907 domain-containing protein [Flavobacteriales bacterium]
MRHLIVLFTILLGPAVGAVNAQTVQDTSVMITLSGIELRPFETDNGWGYDIFLNGKKYIHQTTIPSMSGTSGFASKADATIVGDLVVGKLERNEMPPSVTPEELDSLGVVLPEK